VRADSPTSTQPAFEPPAAGGAPPELSVIVTTVDDFETVRKTVRHLRAQTVRERLEIVLVCPSADRLALDPAEVAGVGGVRVVEVGAITSSAAARAAGIRAAAASVIALAEDHCFPAPDWAEALIAAHRGPWVAVGPVLGNANPRTMLSWANLIVEYGPWMAPAAPREIDHLPGHNSSYKRAPLLEYGDHLREMMEAESVMQWDLVAKGHRLYHEPAARTFHLNYSLLSHSIALRFFGGRVFGGCRSRHWPAWRRLLYTLGAPLIPAVRLTRLVRSMRRSPEQRPLLPRIVPTLALTLAVDGLGELVGYALGPGNANAILTRLEFHRPRHLNARDRAAEEASVAPPSPAPVASPEGHRAYPGGHAAVG
jgi:hypothetical protein